MAYTVTNYKTKKELKLALVAGGEVHVYQPGPFGATVPNGVAYLEGPHYPQAHTWYAQCRVQNGKIIPGSVK